MRRRPISRVHILRGGGQAVYGVRDLGTHHGHSIQLPQGPHGLEHDDNKTTTFNRLYCAGKKVGRNRLEVLEYAHAKSLAKDFMGLFVVPSGRVQGEYENEHRRAERRTYTGYR